jgi:thioredoxin-like negative regulator of GroEL
MATVALTKDTFPETARANPIVFLVFWAGWCPACREFMPVYTYAAQRHPDLVFGTADTTVPEQREVAGYFGLEVIPTVVVVKDGHMIHHLPGGQTHQQFADLIRDVRAADVGQMVRAASRPAQPGVIRGSRLR